MTAAYMTRCVYLTFYGEPRGHAADTEHPPHESGPRIVVPLYILSGLAIVGRLRQPPGRSRWLPADWTLRFEHYYEPKGAYFPSGLERLRASRVQPLDRAGRRRRSASLGIGLAVRSGTSGASAPTASPQRNRLARAGHRVLVQKYYLDWLYTDVIVGAVKGPIARGRLLVQPEGHRRRRQRRRRRRPSRSGQFVYDKIDQGIVDTLVDGSGAAAEGSGQVLRLMQTGRVQQYAALLFAATAVLAGHLHHRHLRNQDRTGPWTTTTSSPTGASA